MQVGCLRCYFLPRVSTFEVVLLRISSCFYVLMSLVSLPLRGQSSRVDMLFGANVTKPICSEAFSGKSDWRLNFWVGADWRRQYKPSRALHIGLFSNGINYRFQSPDSPQVTFISLNYLSVPVQLEFLKPGSQWGFLLGVEPKRSIRGYENTAEPMTRRRIDFNRNNTLYRSYNLGFRTGVTYRKANQEFFLQLSGDALPFREYGSQRATDFKIIFGFSFWNLFEQ